MQSLVQPAASLDDALNVYRTSSSGWETADDYYYNSNSHRPSLHTVADPGIQLHSVQPLPSTFITQYNNVQYKSFMGLFPQINRAWLTVDSNLFLWAYSPFRSPSSPNDFYVYEGLSQIIVSVALVPPRPGVFVESVKFLIAVATSVEVTLLGVTFSPTGELSLVPTHISVATDNTLMLKILATPTGRIFMAGADGALHEFEYDASPRSSVLDLISGRPAKRARKLSHNSASFSNYLLPAAFKSFFARSDEIVDLAVDVDVLYTLSQEGLLTVYDVSSGARSIAAVNVKNDVKSMTFSLPASDREFVSIHAVPAAVSNSVQLIVVTSFGERIYYATHSFSRFTDSSGPRASRPRTLRFASFRPCPDQDPRRSRPCVHIAWCERGTAVFADLKEEESDRLIAVYPDASVAAQSSSGPDYRAGSVKTAEIVFEKSLGEYDNRDFSAAGLLATPLTRTAGATNGYGGGSADSYGPKRTFAIAEAPSGEQQAEDQEGPLESPNFFWVLTSTAMHLYERIQPIDRLREILASRGGSSSEIQEFFRRYGPAEACAMCLEIAMSNQQLSAAAAKVFYTYGGEPMGDKKNPPADPGSRSRGGDWRRGSDARAGVNEVQRESAFDVGRPSMQAVPLTRFSGAHDGTAWYLAKVLHPVWTNFITSDRDPEAYQRLCMSKTALGRIRDRLLAVIAFLDKYTPETMLPEVRAANRSGQDVPNGQESREVARYRTPNGTLRGPKDEDRVDDQERLFRGLYQLKRTGEARQAESSSILALKSLAGRTVEALALLLILSDHQLHRLVVSLPKDTRALLSKVRLCDLVVAEVGMVVSAALIEAIFSSYRDGTAAVSNIGKMLQERCSSYFGESDIDLHQGLALLRQAVETFAGARSEANGATMNSGYDARAGLLTPNSGSAASWEAAMNLAEEAARILKTVPSRIFDIVAVCEDFKLVRAIPFLADVGLTVGKAAEGVGNEARVKTAYECVLDALRPFFNAGADPGRGQDAGNRERLKDATMRIVLRAESDLFLKRLYEFLIESESGREELLREKSLKVEAFLHEKEARDLLWRYFAKHERYLEAAVVLQELAEKEGQVGLVDRLNYLSCALHNANTASSKGDGRASAVLSEVSDYMEVAKVQLRVREELRQRQGPTEEVRAAAEELDSDILDLSSLFNKYARPFELFEASLAIFRCGSYRDEAYIKGLWTEIIEREAEEAVTPALVSQKMQALGREFYPSEVAFPTSYIIDLLERLVYRNSEIAGWGELSNWVCSTMEGMGVPLADVVNGYRQTIENPQAVDGWSWTEEGAQMHLLRAAERVIDKWLQRMGTKGRGVLSEADKALRAISLCKSRLRGMSCAGVDALVERFDRLEQNVSPLVQNSGF